MTAPECLVAAGDVCGEGLTFSAAQNALFWTDINRFLLHRYSLATREMRTWLFDEPVVATSLTVDDDVLLVALASKLILWRPATDERHDQGFDLTDYPGKRLNDGRSDPFGRFLALLWLPPVMQEVFVHLNV